MIVLLSAAPALLISAADKKQTPRKDPKEIFMETQWGITRTHFTNGNHSTHSESFKETWYVKQVAEKLILTSPRASIEIDGFKTTGKRKLSLSSLRLTRSQLFDLLGISVESDVAASIANDRNKITLSKSEGGLGSTKSLSYDLENEESLQIEFRLATSAE